MLGPHTPAREILWNPRGVRGPEEALVFFTFPGGKEEDEEAWQPPRRGGAVVGTCQVPPSSSSSVNCILISEGKHGDAHAQVSVACPSCRSHYFMAGLSKAGHDFGALTK